MRITGESFVSRGSHIALHAHAGVALGCLYIMVAGAGALLTMALKEDTLIAYAGVLSLSMHTATVLFVNFCCALGLVKMSSFFPLMLAYNVVAVLEDSEMRIPFLAVTSVMHVMNHFIQHSTLWNDPFLSACNIAVHVFLGAMLPRALTFAAPSLPRKLPEAVFTGLSAASHGLLVSELVTSTRSIVEPVQDLATAGSSAAQWIVDKALVAVGGGSDTAYRYGLPQSVSVGAICSAILIMVLCSSVMSILDGGERSLQSSSMLQMTYITMLQQLPANKKATICGLVAVATLQGAAVVNAATISLFDIKASSSAAPAALLTLLAGVVLEVIGALYIASPDSSPGVDHHTSVDTVDSRYGYVLEKSSKN